jgi:hypothetical protein
MKDTTVLTVAHHTVVLWAVRDALAVIGLHIVTSEEHARAEAAEAQLVAVRESSFEACEQIGALLTPGAEGKC